MFSNSIFEFGRSIALKLSLLPVIIFTHVVNVQSLLRILCSPYLHFLHLPSFSVRRRFLRNYPLLLFNYKRQPEDLFF